MTIKLSDGSILEKFDYARIDSDPLNKENSNTFIHEKLNEQSALKCLYVGQREYATVQQSDPHIDIIGSDDATTCHIVLFVDENNGNSSLCHFDGSDLRGGVEAMIENLKILANETSSTTYFLYIVGGFDDPPRSSFELTLQLFGMISLYFFMRFLLSLKIDFI